MWEGVLVRRRPSVVTCWTMTTSHMTPKFVRFLIFVLALTLPLRSFASATMFPCSNVSQSGTAAAEMQSMEHMVPMSVLSNTHQEDGGSQSVHHPAQTHCADCCTAYLNIAVPRHFSNATPRTVVPYIEHAFIGFIGDPAQRPPSPFFA